MAFAKLLNSRVHKPIGDVKVALTILLTCDYKLGQFGMKSATIVQSFVSSSLFPIAVMAQQELAPLLLMWGKKERKKMIAGK